MANGKDIKRYSVQEIRAIRARGESCTEWAAVDAMSEEEIEAAIASDPDEAEIEWEWERAEVVIPKPKEQAIPNSSAATSCLPSQ